MDSLQVVNNNASRSSLCLSTKAAVWPQPQQGQRRLVGDGWRRTWRWNEGEKKDWCKGKHNNGSVCVHSMKRRLRSKNRFPPGMYSFSLRQPSCFYLFFSLLLGNGKGSSFSEPELMLGNRKQDGLHWKASVCHCFKCSLGMDIQGQMQDRGSCWSNSLKKGIFYISDGTVINIFYSEGVIFLWRRISGWITYSVPSGRTAVCLETGRIWERIKGWGRDEAK